jgi:hypothetical protein
MVLLLALVLSGLLCSTFLPGNIPFSNDGPLGRLMAQCHRLPARFTGCWEDLNLLGDRDWGAAPSISFGLEYLLGPFVFAKFYAVLALLVLGLGAWTFFRQSGLAPAACLLGGLAAALGSSFFSAACWGVASHPISMGMIFFALAALADTSSRIRWLRVVLAGLAVGMAVTEGADIGALFSMGVGVFVVYQALVAEGARAKNVAAGLGRLALVAVCAVLLAAQALSGLLATDIEGMAGTEQDITTKAKHWDWATQWSLPKAETLSLVVPGLFGYLGNTPNGGEYWGAVGRAPAWDRYFAQGSQGEPPKGFLRYSGGGSYAGVLVALVAIWAAAQSLRRKDSVFGLPQRKLLWFWAAAGLVSLLLSYGRFAPFYRVLYALPYFSTIRNPVKFLHISAFVLVVLFAYGVDGLWRRHMQPTGAGAVPGWPGLRRWWARAGRFDKRWALGCLLALGVSLLAWLVYATSRGALEHYLQRVQFNESKAQIIAGFSIGQVGWFVLFFVLGAGVMILILSGAFVGVRAKWGAAMLGVLLVADLGRANQPWISHWNFQEKYAANSVIDLLREKPYEHRVALMRFRVPEKLSIINRLYESQWLKHQFPYYSIQSLDSVQMSRMPADIAAYQKALSNTNETGYLPVLLRSWQLTNTRYLVGPAALSTALNRRIDSLNPEFRVLERFDVVPLPGISRATNVSELTVVPSDTGAFALTEFTRALPRAKLYATWQVTTNDASVLVELASSSFDPEQSVFVAGGAPVAPPATNANPGKVEFASYAPKDIVLKCDAQAPSVLLLNDRFDSYWKVRVDGRPQALLRCNYIMRGVYLSPGAHTVEFRFQPPVGPLYVSLVGVGIGVLVLGTVFVAGRRSSSPVPAPVSPPPAAPPKPGAKSAPGRASGPLRRRVGLRGVQ